MQFSRLLMSNERSEYSYIGLADFFLFFNYRCAFMHINAFMHTYLSAQPDFCLVWGIMSVANTLTLVFGVFFFIFRKKSYLFTLNFIFFGVLLVVSC